MLFMFFPLKRRFPLSMICFDRAAIKQRCYFIMLCSTACKWHNWDKWETLHSIEMCIKYLLGNFVVWCWIESRFFGTDIFVAQRLKTRLSIDVLIGLCDNRILNVHLWLTVTCNRFENGEKICFPKIYI